jgi:hypothetical protein
LAPAWAGLRAGFLASVIVAPLSVAAELREAAARTAVPQRGDHTLLSWREGPPYFTTARYASERRFLRVETGWFAAEFDTEAVTLAGFAAWERPRDETAATRHAIDAPPLPAARLHLRIRVGGVEYVCTGRRPLALDSHGLPAKPAEFPVRVIESGRFFQKFALHDLEFRDAAGRRLAGASWLEISAWPDRLGLTLVVRPEESLPEARAFLRLETAGGRDASWTEAAADWDAAVERRATLTLAADGSARAPGAPDGVAVRVGADDPRGGATVRWNAEEGCHEVALRAAPWPQPAEGMYPEKMLDAWETCGVTVENRTAVPQRIALNFDYSPVKSITGYVPMVIDDGGEPTGIPVQISKNWHVAGSGRVLPYAGQWMHGRTWLNVEPHARLAVRYGTAFARWGGVPAASLAQLSLVGWGHNGFWEQFALGAFGESFCFQPARVMRRALLTDFRPLFQQGFGRGDRWSWTSNLGGGDTMVRFDPQGRYVPFRRNVTRHASSGPNLAHLDYEELAADGAVRSRVEVWLPRTDDAVRVYLKVRYEVRRRVEFARLALFQLGADHYNDTASPRVAWGDAEGLAGEEQPGPGTAGLPRWEGRGEAPWVSLHGQPRADFDRAGQGTRGLVVREWRATLGGRPVPAPWFSAARSRNADTTLGVDLVPPPGLAVLEAGDEVEMLLELIALPLTVERYHGPDRALRTALAGGANTWRPVHREARFNRPEIATGAGTAKGFPLTVPYAGDETVFTLRGGLGWIPLRLSGLPGPEGPELFRRGAGGLERITQGDPERAFWQTDYDAAAERWRITYNLPAAAEAAVYVARIRHDAGLAAPAGRR